MARNTNFARSYSDQSGKVEISQDDSTVASFDLSAISQETRDKAAMRYFADIVVGQGNAAIKADGGTVEKAAAKMAETIKALTDGSFTFRAASGSGGLSLEDEHKVIAETIVSLGKAADYETALAKVQALYAKTKVSTRKDKDGNLVMETDEAGKPTDKAKEFTTRPDYNALRNVPQIKVALADANKAESNLDSLLA